MISNIVFDIPVLKDVHYIWNFHFFSLRVSFNNGAPCSSDKEKPLYAHQMVRTDSKTQKLDSFLQVAPPGDRDPKPSTSSETPSGGNGNDGEGADRTPGGKDVNMEEEQPSTSRWVSLTYTGGKIIILCL